MVDNFILLLANKASYVAKPSAYNCNKTNHWDNYELIEDLEPEFNGSHLRYLFKYIDEHLERFSYIAKPSETLEEFIEGVSNNIVQNLSD